jgi:hypothetical protein
MQSRWWGAPLSVLYLAWAFYLLNIPDMPNPHAADIGFLSLWAFRSLNLIGGLPSIAVVQICWHAHVWFFSPDYQQLSTSGFVVFVAIMLLIGVLQWLWVGMLMTRFYRAVRQRSAQASKQS